MYFQPCASSFGRPLRMTGRLRRIVEIVLDLVDLRQLRQFHDVERAVLEGDAVRPVEPRGDDLHLALAALVDDGIDLVLQPRANEHGALVAERERARIRHAAGIDLDLEALRHLDLVERQLVGRPLRAAEPAPERASARREYRGRPMSGRAGRQRRRRLLRGRRPRRQQQRAESSSEHEALSSQRICHELSSSLCKGRPWLLRRPAAVEGRARSASSRFSVRYFAPRAQSVFRPKAIDRRTRAASRLGFAARKMSQALSVPPRGGRRS
jgi:hypothetical protein